MNSNNIFLKNKIIQKIAHKQASTEKTAETRTCTSTINNLGLLKSILGPTNITLKAAIRWWTKISISRQSIKVHSITGARHTKPRPTLYWNSLDFVTRPSQLKQSHWNRTAIDHYTAVRWLVHWPLMGGLLRLVRQRGAWAGCGPAQAPPRCTRIAARPSMASVPITVLLCNGQLLCDFNVTIKGLSCEGLVTKSSEFQ